MKIEEFLGKSTLVSSRTLTIYSSTILAILWTETRIGTLPVISMLQGPEYAKYAVVLAVLVFMTGVHVVNFSSDYFSAKAKFTSEVMTDIAKGPGQHTGPDFSGINDEYLTSIRQEAADYADLSRRWTWIARYGLHLYVPIGLALPTCATLIASVYFSSLTSVAK